MLQGAIHIHSTYSDGKFTLRELRETFLAEGCAFLCLTDHAEYFDSARLQAYCGECQALSDATLRIIPGLEYACLRDMHILGYGAALPADSKDPEQVIAQVNAQGAISVVAHPKDEFFDWIESFQTLPQGIETWNTKYDGRYAPRPATFALVERLRRRRPDLHAFYGLDLHWKHQYRKLLIQVDCPTNGASDVLAALACGNYFAVSGRRELPSSGVLPQQLLDEFARARGRSEPLRRLAHDAKRALDRWGIQVPESVKAHLRRLL